MPPKNSLGRGLGAMFPDLLNHIGDRPSFVRCGIEELTPNRFQPRRDFNDEDQKELVVSVKKSGIIQPIIVRKADTGYEIIVGERRWRAAQAAGLKEVPIIIRKAEDRELAELSLIENIQREALNPLEEADAYQTLLTRFSLSQEEISSPRREGPLHHRQHGPAAEASRGGQEGPDRQADHGRTCPGAPCPGSSGRADQRAEDHPAEGPERPGYGASDPESEKGARRRKKPGARIRT